MGGRLGGVIVAGFAVNMHSARIAQFGFWTGLALVCLGLVYLGLLAAMMLLGSGFPPTEPFQTAFHVLILLTAASMVVFWTLLHEAVPPDRKPFSRASLAFVVIFATLTSINRYVGLTVVKQGIASGSTEGLQWFLPYGWPSVMLALEILAWGFFFGLACLCLAPAFSGSRLDRAISLLLIAIGIMSLLSALGPVLGYRSLDFSPFTIAGVLAWGPGLTAAFALMAVWFRRRKVEST